MTELNIDEIIGRCAKCGRDLKYENGEKSRSGVWQLVCGNCGFTQSSIECQSRVLENIFRNENIFLNNPTSYEIREDKENNYRKDISVKRYPRVSWVSKSSDGSIDIRNLCAPGEMDSIEAAIVGSKWIRFNNGRLEVSDAYIKIPTPIEDPYVADEWQCSKDGVMKFSFNYKHTRYGKRVFNDAGGSILIHSLCGYNYSKGNYERCANLLISYGFNCTRSSRGEDGHFWEVWYLPGLWCAKGELQKILEGYSGADNDNGYMDLAVNYISRNVDFGALDVVAQRMCMVID